MQQVLTVIVYTSEIKPLHVDINHNTCNILTFETSGMKLDKEVLLPRRLYLQIEFKNWQQFIKYIWQQSATYIKWSPGQVQQLTISTPLLEQKPVRNGDTTGYFPLLLLAYLNQEPMAICLALWLQKVWAMGVLRRSYM